MPTNTDYTPLDFKLESALVAYLDSITVSAGLTGLQILTSMSDTEALETPRAIVTVANMDAHSVDLPGIMNCQTEIVYVSQIGNTTINNHRVQAAKLISWLHDLAAVKTALSTTNALNCYHIQFISSRFEKNADDGTMISTFTFNYRVQGKQI